MLFNMALKNGNLISINEVKSGLKCDCFCPVCNSQLVARKGKIKVHHFAHYNSNECESYGESMLHLLAKKIIEENKYLLVPDFDKEVGSYSNLKKIDLTKIEVEKGYNDIKPDIIAWVDDENNFFVEIAVTHKVDYEKLLKIKEYNVSTLEIDLGDYYRSNENFDYNLFKEIILSGVYNKRWIFDKKHRSKLEKHKKILREIEYKANIERKQQKKIEEQNRLLEIEVSKKRCSIALEKYVSNDIIGVLWEDRGMSLSGGIVFNNIKFDMLVSKNPLVRQIDRPDIKLKLVKYNPKKFQSCGIFILNKGYIKIFQKKIDIEIVKNISKENNDSSDYFIKRIFHKQKLLKENEVKEIEVKKDYFCEVCNNHFLEKEMGTYQINTKIGKCKICLNFGLKNKQ